MSRMGRRKSRTASSGSATKPSWQAIAQRRLAHSTAKCGGFLRYQESFGFDAELKLGLAKLGFKLGGQYADFEETVWEFEAVFA